MSYDLINKLKKILIALFMALLLSIVLIIASSVLLPNILDELKTGIMFLLVLPLLISVVLLAAAIFKFSDLFVKNLMTSKEHIVKSILGDSARFDFTYRFPLEILTDPAINVSYANAFEQNSSIKGNYCNGEFAFANVDSTNYTNSDEISSTIFHGSYILFSPSYATPIQKSPVFVYSDGFWKKFNTNNASHFKVKGQTIVEVETVNGLFTVMSTDKSKAAIVKTQNFQQVLSEISNAIENEFALFFYDDGKIGLSIQDLVLFDIRKQILFDIRKQFCNEDELNCMIKNHAFILKKMISAIQCNK